MTGTRCPNKALECGSPRGPSGLAAPPDSPPPVLCVPSGGSRQGGGTALATGPSRRRRGHGKLLSAARRGPRAHPGFRGCFTACFPDRPGQSKPMTQNRRDLGASTLLATCHCLLRSRPRRARPPGCSRASVLVALGLPQCVPVRPPSPSCASELRPCCREGGGLCLRHCPGQTPPAGKPHPGARCRSPRLFWMFFFFFG